MNMFAALGLKAIQTGAKVVSTAEKNSPEILIGTGIILGVAAGVTACMATAKAEETLDEIKEDIEEAKEAPEEEQTKEVTKAYVKATGKMVRLYWMPMTLCELSITSILTGHNILRKRHIALAAAYGTLEKAYDGLKKRIEEEFSKEAADRFANGIKVVEDPRDDGKKKKGTIDLVDPDKVLGPYTYIFGPDCALWTD